MGARLLFRNPLEGVMIRSTSKFFSKSGLAGWDDGYDSVQRKIKRRQQHVAKDQFIYETFYWEGIMCGLNIYTGRLMNVNGNPYLVD
jgi:hypothetical protein